MKRRELIAHLEANDCLLLREGARHSIYFHKGNQTTSSVPRHNEVNNFLAKKICNDLGIDTFGMKK